jgi:hypothetical protein
VLDEGETDTAGAAGDDDDFRLLGHLCSLLFRLPGRTGGTGYG